MVQLHWLTILLLSAMSIPGWVMLFMYLIDEGVIKIKPPDDDEG